MSRHAKQQRRWRESRAERAQVGAASSVVVACPEAWPSSSPDLEPSAPPIVSQRASQAAPSASGAVARLMSLKVCAAAVGCSVKTIRRMIDAGTFPRPVRMAGKLMIVAAEFETWYQERLNDRP